MTDLIPGTSPFDSIRHVDEHGEYWLARELMVALGYSASWQNFNRVIEEAKAACASQAYDVLRLFNAVVKKSSGGRPAQDYQLTRFACYMIALSADGTKDEVAAAKVYFAIKTRAQEEAEAIPGTDALRAEWRRRTILSFQAAGYSVERATRRADDILARNDLTNEWVVRGIEQHEIPILTNELHMGSFGISIHNHKALKDFPVTYDGKRIVYKDDLPPAMTATELALNALASTVSRELHVANDSQGFTQIRRDVQVAGDIVGRTRKDIEAATGRPVVSAQNMLKERDGGLWAALPSPDDAPEKEGC